VPSANFTFTVRVMPSLVLPASFISVTRARGQCPRAGFSVDKRTIWPTFNLSFVSSVHVRNFGKVSRT
jgi:hypothetical protein